MWLKPINLGRLINIPVRFERPIDASKLLLLVEEVASSNLAPAINFLELFPESFAYLLYYLCEGAVHCF